MQHFGDLSILSFVRIRRLDWICLLNRVDSARKVSQVFNNNPEVSRLRGRPKNRWLNCVQTDINNCRITNWNERSKNRADWEKCVKEGEGAYWAVVPSKKKKKEKGNNRKEEEEEEEGGGEEEEEKEGEEEEEEVQKEEKGKKRKK